MSNISIRSEIGRLRRVIVHEPGQEVENVTPSGAHEALYDDILFLQPALREHRQMTGVLRSVARVDEFVDLLSDVLAEPHVRSDLVGHLTDLHGCPERASELADCPPERLARQLIRGTPMRKNTLAKHLDPRRFDLPPLSNMFFMRDAAMCVGNRAVIGAMATPVRRAEAALLRAVFRHHPTLEGPLRFDGVDYTDRSITLEGGDLQVIRDDLLVIGQSDRTSVAGIDRLLRALAERNEVWDVIVVILPSSRATIHLDMIFTMVDRDVCVVHEPLIVGERRCRAIHIHVEGGRVAGIDDRRGLLDALADLGVSLTPIRCGGDDPVRQEREQWASGANFFAFGPGKVIGYGRNRATLDAMSAHGFEIVGARDVIAGRVDPDDYPRCAVTMSGAESSRGGGGCRCMTLPVQRAPL